MIVVIVNISQFPIVKWLEKDWKFPQKIKC